MTCKDPTKSLENKNSVTSLLTFNIDLLIKDRE